MDPLTIVVWSLVAGGVLGALAIPMIPREYYGWMGGAVGVVLLTAVIILIVQYARGKPMDTGNLTKDLDVYSSVVKPAPLACPADSGNHLCDYYVASSAYSVIPGNTVYSYTTEEAITKVIAAGARLVELHVYDEKGAPVVGLSDTITGQKYTYNTTPFEACCTAVANAAFSAGTTTASSDPFILSIVFHTENTKVLNACAEIMKTTLRMYMLDSSYSYQRKIIPNEPVCNFANKLIVVSGANTKGTMMDELVNLSFGSSHLRRLTYTEAAQTHDYQELIDYNKKNITMVVPDGSASLVNSNPQILFTYGCQWVMMNYGSLDSGMENYTGQFAGASTVLKPDALRFKPVTYKKPKVQDPEKSFQPKQQVSPVYNVTI